ncbi:NAD(P) transhydrogenase subunit beta [Caenibius tardaugens NBRC 16725]|uniref:NAD(P) transhydrogenase subunit beta n=1 Tax=Caenibius tardaugens NBRC 16725 TaxID=1219035 RepID=U2YNM2_9SPHN|nr:NAD(P)(+) transhydrogenase (Re/Si-specific) subunit beta [Caenibius tardaugens]AZI35543.1 NAD(P)(+) transhydrogenase (Re/Si-specific) subunit beta [Caenibius tardaugens NBRC 16725]GAD50177.1 NAD(P) transhydrogenase subunit beta [Caenibius tardaugens NBRC 16725]
MIASLLEGETLVQIAYLIASGLFVLALMWMSSPKTARRGVWAGEVGMVLAVVGTLLHHDVVSYDLILIAMLIGTAIGVPMAYLMPMTAIPQRTAISHAFGALAVGLIGVAEYYKLAPTEAPGSFVMWALMFEMLLGFLTCTASVIAFAKLQEIMPTRPIMFSGQRLINLAVFAAAIVIGGMLIFTPTSNALFPAFIALALIFGMLLVIPIGGADMPTVIALLNSYAGLAASAMGFALNNKLLIIVGALDGTSGFILAMIMCKAMNRSFSNVLFGGFGQMAASSAGKVEERPVRSMSAEEAAPMLDMASSVVIIPGYGMAVAQAQHRVAELYEHLEEQGIDVKFAIHPVAGRMPGHMNVLLAEADVPYDKLVELEDINPEMPQTDVALIVGANDTVNPSARDDPNSAIAGMPIIEADKARTVMVVKRGMSAGFAGIENPIYYNENTQMLFGDAKKMSEQLVKELHELND